MPSSFVGHVLDLLRPLGGVSARRMFGGYGLYKDGLMFALIAEDILYFKADTATEPSFRSAGMHPFTYRRRGRRTPVVMSYWEAPPELFDDAEAMARWAARALDAAGRARKSGPTRPKPAPQNF